jgi:type III secretion system HrpB2-like protein
MDTTSFVSAVRPTSEIGPSLDAPFGPAAAPSAPPELVSKFQALMGRVPGAEAADASANTNANANARLVPAEAVAKVDDHIRHHAEIIDRVASVKSGEMSLADLQVMQMQSTVQLGMMSMTQAAYFQVLGSSKSSVSALMKNQ